MKNHYNVLELDKNCTPEEIKESYIKLSKKYHPDKNKSEEAQKKILEINEAYSVLKNKSSRCRYDERLEWLKAEQKINQAKAAYYRTRPQTYDEYVHYYQKRSGQESLKAQYASRHVSLVLCCCMLMVFGAGLRIMYACSEVHNRRILSQNAAKNISATSESKKEQLEKFRQVWESRLQREKEEKKSES